MSLLHFMRNKVYIKSIYCFTHVRNVIKGGLQAVIIIIINWDLNVSSIAESYVTVSAREAAAALELATSRKEDTLIFAAVGLPLNCGNTLGPFNASACQLLANLGGKISQS